MHTEKAEPSFARLSCRVSARIKHQAEKAASLLGQSITDFTDSALADKAQAVLERHERLILSERDCARFVAAIEHPAEPTEGLKALMAEHSRRVKPSTGSGA
jgi:uncharacterized protein (DUF1778 family)